MILADFARALGQFFDPRFMRVLLIGVALSLALLFGVYAGFVQILDWLTPDTFTLPWVGEVTWVKDLLGWGSLALMIGLSVFLMVPVASAFTGLFLDDVAKAVEDRHYPGLPPAPRLPFFDVLIDSLTSDGPGRTPGPSCVSAPRRQSAAVRHLPQTSSEEDSIRGSA